MRALLLLFGIFCFSACGEDEAVRYQLTPDEREAYQDMATARIDSLRPLLDSLCTTTKEARIATATDSIVQLRLEEELRLRARLGQSVGE